MAESKPLSLDKIRSSENLLQKKAQLKDLQNLVSPHFAVAWKEIGEELGIKLGSLNILQKDNANSEICCDKMLDEWLNIDACARWGTIIKALDSPKVVAVKKSFSNPNTILQYSEVDMLEAVLEVANRLQKNSKSSRYSKTEDEWPPYRPKHFTSIALIHYKKGHSTKKEITFVASIQHTGQLSQTEPPCSHIIQTSSEFSEVFSKIEGTSEFPNTVLIEGAPGIGKTTLCKEIIFQWSGQKLLENKKLVVLIFLRDPIAQSIISLKDFIRYYCIYTEIGNSILEEYIKSTAGKDIAIVLDGYDELPENIRKNPEHSELFFIKLIHQRKYTHMSQCTVVITSRLNVSGELHGIVDRRVEILGFTENNRKEYIQQALKDNKENVEKMLSYLDRNPSINAYCYIPLNMTILLCLFAEGEENSELPATQTEINRMFICITISRFIRKTQKVKMECGISNFKDMPKEFKHIFIGLCRLAYKTLRDDKIVFSKREIQNYCKHLARTENCHGLGLLKAVEFYSTRENVKSMSFNFLHLSLQETLAAYHIYLSSINKQARLLENKFMDSRYFNTWIMYVGFTKGQSFPFAFEHFLSGNSLKVITFVSSLFKQDAKISEKFITDKVICLHLFQCFSEAENDDMCQFVGQLLQDGEIDLSDQTLNTVNIHTIGLFLDRSSIKHWKLLKLSNCNLSTLEIERLFILCRKVCIDQLDLSYNNLTQMPTDILANVFLTWNVKKVIMYSNVFETSYRYNIINNCVRQFSKLKLVPLPFQTEIFALDQPILVVCKCSYQEIIATLSKNNYSSIHLFSCQLGSALYEITQLNLMSESSKNIYLYNCEISCSHVLEIVRKMEISSVHFMEESNISSKELGYVVEQLAELAITLGKEMLPLHIYNMAETSFLAAKELMQDGTPGTFVFRHCTDQDIHEIASYYNSQNNISRFILKHCTGYHGESISSNVVTNNLSNLFSNNILLRHLSLCNCKLQNDTVHELLDTTMKLTNLQHIILSGNSISNKTAELLATSIINAKFLEHLELEGCNLHQIGLELVSKAINSSNLLTLNLNYNCITDQVANNLADVIASKSCLENLCMSKCSLQYGAKAIVSALAKITSLKILDLSYNKITNSSFDLIAVTKTNIHLEHLNMSYCELKQDSMIEVLKAHCTDLKLIDFSGNDINDSAAVCLPNFVNSAPLLQTLALAKCHLEETDLIDTLRAVKHSLNYLDISFNTITVKAAKSVADLIHNNVDLEYFDLSNCNIQEEGLILILKEVRTACYLKYIDVQSNSLNNALASELAVFISSSHTLSHLSLSNCALQEDGFLRIADSLVKTKTLTHLDISSNFISNNVGAKLALTVVFSKKSQLKHLDVSECQWQENGLTKFLTSAMIVCSLRHINYSSCKLDDEQAKYLANSIISNGTLEHLILANCALTPVGLISIFDALTKLHKLKHIDLSHNQFTNAAVTILADVISSNHIEHLDLLHCLQGANSLAILTAIANSATLQYLDLSHNDIGDNEVNYVTSAITANNNLHSINLTNNCFDPQSIHIILFALAKMDLIHYLNLSSYSIVDKLVTDLEAVCISNNRLENIVVCEYTNLKYNDYLQQCVSRLILSKLCINHHTVCDSEVWILESVITNSSSICHLDLSETTISDSRKRMIMGAIKKYSMLMHLNLYGFKFSGGVINILVSLLAQNTKLKYLNIARCGLNIMFLVALADVLCTHKELLHIDLSYNHLSTTTGTDISFVLPETAVLQHLNISACRLKEVVFLNVIKTLTWLDLSYNPISDQGAGDVAKLITNNVNLQHLNLFKCAFESRGVLMIIKALKNLIKLQYLNLGSNHLSDELECIAVEMAAVITNNKVIQDLYLPHCQFCKRDMMMLFKAMTFITCLQHVDIGCNEISNTCIRDVFTKNLSLQEIRMDKLVMSQTELNEVSGILAKFRVQHFSLCQCFISDKQLSQLCEIFNSSDVTHFSITDCVFSDEHMGGSKLFESLRDTWNLKHLDLKGITLTDDSIEHVIATNENIEYFSLIDCTMSDSKVSNFFKAFENNNHLQTFSVINMFMKDSMCVANAFKTSKSLTYLNLSNCKLQEEVVLQTCTTVSTVTNLHHINLSGNNITNCCAELLAFGISKNLLLQELELASCNLATEGLGLICKAITRELQVLNLNCNFITAHTAKTLADMITSTNHIKILQLKKCLGSNGIKIIISALAKIKSLHILDLSYNKMTDINSRDVVAVIVANDHLETLDLSYCDLSMKEMIRTKYLNLRVFNFKGNQISKSAASCIKKFANKSTKLCLPKLTEIILKEIKEGANHSLKHLDLSSYTISDKAAQLLTSIIQYNIGLDYLDLSNCELLEKGFSFILEAVKKSCRLTYLNLKSNRINNLLAGEIAEFISSNDVLRHLSLSKCSLQEEGFLKIAKALLNTSLIYFDISYNIITWEIATELAKSKMFVVNYQLKHLDVTHCEWKKDSFTILLNAMTRHVVSLKSLCISSCEMDTKKTQDLVCIIGKNRTLEQLTLSKCILESAQLITFFRALKTLHTLRHLDLSCKEVVNSVYDDLAKVIACSLIEHLNLSHCLKGVDSSAVLIAIAKCVTIQYLDLSYDGISDYEASSVASAIKSNKYLYHLNLTSNWFSTKGIKLLLNAMASIRSLQYVNFDSYTITDELTDDVTEVATSNCGLETILVLKSRVRNITLEERQMRLLPK